MPDAILKGRTQQQNPAINSDGGYNGVRQTRDGCLFTADWKTNLVMRGLVYQVKVGDMAAGADVAPIVGGGNGTVCDLDQPEMIVQTPATHFHVPISCRCAIQADAGGADADEHSIILGADVTPAAIIATATATSPTVYNLLDGAAGSISTAFTAVTADITDPTTDMILDFETSQAAQVTAASTVVHVLKMDYEPKYPTFLRGMCAVVLCFGGTNACSGIATYTWAEIPIAQIE